MATLTAPVPSQVAAPVEVPSLVDKLAQELETHGIVRLPALVDENDLRDMQTAFAGRLRRLRWNDFEGYERTERFRLMVQDILTVAHGFLTVALHPVVKRILDRYLGDSYELVEAKGWKSLPTQRDFHGWHGDCWYDQDKVKDVIPREIKLGFYLTDVKTGAFQFIKASHGRQAPRQFKKYEVKDLPMERMIEIAGPAGSAFLFDTSGIHRQSIPIVEPRQAFFLNYHDPRVPLQQEDVEYYRYHPLLLNAAFLGNLGPEDTRILGFGNKHNYIPGFERCRRHGAFQTLMNWTYATKLVLTDLGQRVTGKFRRLWGGR